MTMERLKVTVTLRPVAGSTNSWTSDALAWPGASVERVFSNSSGQDIAYTMDDDFVLLRAPADQHLPLYAVVSIRNDLLLGAVDAIAPHALEETKLALEEKWRRRTFVWTIASALITAAVSVSVAIIQFDGSDDGRFPESAVVGKIQECRDSLQRLETLANISGQTVGNLKDAVNRHKQACDETLIDILAEAAQ